MRTTLDIPATLINQVVKISKQRSKKGAVILALQEYLRMKDKDNLIASFGKIPMKLNIRKMRQNRDLG